jgi:hypothetical protein
MDISTALRKGTTTQKQVVMNDMGITFGKLMFSYWVYNVWLEGLGGFLAAISCPLMFWELCKAWLLHEFWDQFHEMVLIFRKVPSNA